MTIEFDLKVCVGCGVEVCLVWFGLGRVWRDAVIRARVEQGRGKWIRKEGRMDGWMGECFRAERGFESAWEE